MRSIQIHADDQMIRALELLARDESKSMEALAREVLERYLRVRSKAKPRPDTATRHGPAKPYRIRPISVGRCHFENLDNVAEVLAAAEGEDYG